MTFLDVVKLAGAIMASIGGAGAIIFGLSGFLGKIWADRALAADRQRYEQLNLEMKNQLENASKRLQMELDTIGLVHSLRTKEEFSRLASLWKKFANLSFAFHTMSGPGIRFLPADEEEQTRYLAKLRENFEVALREAQQFFYEEMVFIPEPIAKAAEETVKHALQEPYWYRTLYGTGDSKTTLMYNDSVQKALERFDSGSNHLEQLIRKHIRGESLEVTERPD